MYTKFAQILSEKNDYQLIHIYQDKENYQPLFVEQLLTEIEKRQLMPALEFIEELPLVTEEELKYMQEHPDKYIPFVRPYIEKELNKREKAKELPLIPFSSSLPQTEDKAEDEADSTTRFKGYFIDFILFTLLEFGILSSVEPKDDDITLLCIVTIFLYYFLFEWFTFATPGKWITGTKVVKKDGSRPSFGYILGRTAARFIPFDALSFLFYANWHDKISGTKVIKVQKNTTHVQS